MWIASDPNWKDLKTLGFILLAVITVFVIFHLLVLVTKHQIYRKAGCHGWAAFIPFYTTFTLYRITWGNGWVFLGELIPVIGWAFAVITQIKLAHNFGRGTGFAFGLIFLHPFFVMALGFGQSRYFGIVEDNICNLM